MPALNEKERENLVAYLDGELDEESSRLLESKLTLDPQARAEADALRKTWELLDFLPRPEPSADFTNKTLDRISAQSLRMQRRQWPSWVVWTSWAATILISIGIGFAAMKALTKQGNNNSSAETDPLEGMKPEEIDQQLARHLRVLENKRLYDHVDDMEFLKELDDPELFGDNEQN